MSAKISVVVPVYNVKKYLEQCLDSILAQTLEEIEIICMDDGSTDGSEKILDRYAQKDSRIKVVHKANGGYGHTMNRGFSLCTGEYIGIVESDDFIEKDMFESLYSTARENDLDIARGCYWKNKGGQDVETVSEDYVPKNKVLCPVKDVSVLYQAPAIWAAIYRRSMILQNNIGFLETPGASFQDTSFAFKVYCSCARFMMTDRPFLHYRIDNESSSVNNLQKVYCVCDEYEEIWRYVLGRKLKISDLFVEIFTLQRGAYVWNFDRLAPIYRALFLRRWSREWRELLTRLKKEYGFGHFSADVTEIAYHPWSFYKKHCFWTLTNKYAEPCAIKDSKPLVSVIVTCYNCEKYLEICLRSIARQNYKNIEILCVDDISKDNSAKIARAWEKKDSRIKFLQMPQHGGLSACRNYALRQVKGQWVCFADGDDIFYRDSISALLNATSEHTDIVWSAIHVEYEDFFQSFDEKLRISDANYYAVDKDVEQLCTNEQTCDFNYSVSGKLYRCSVLLERNISFPEGVLYEDFAVNACILAKKRHVRFLSRPTYIYIRHPHSIMSDTFSQKGNMAIQHLFAFEHYYNYIFKEGIIAENNQSSLRILTSVFWFCEAHTAPYNIVSTLNTFIEHIRTYQLDFSGSYILSSLKNGDVRFYFATASTTARETSGLPKHILSYRIGCYLTWPLRMIRNFFRCWKENGFRHTVKRVGVKTICPDFDIKFDKAVHMIRHDGMAYFIHKCITKVQRKCTGRR